MGTTILYCDRCGRIIPPSEADGEKVVVSEVVTVCSSCLETMSENERAELRARVGPDPEPPPPSRRPPTGASHRRTEPHARAHPAAPGGNRTALVVVGSLAGVLAGVAVAVVAVSGGDEQPPPARPYAPAPVVVSRPKPAPPAVPPPVADEPLAYIRRMIDPTLGRYDEIMRMLDAVRDGDEEKAKEAEPALRREVNALYDEVAAGAFAAARATATGLCDEGDLDAAIAQVASVGKRFAASNWFASKGERLIAETREELARAHRARIEKRLALAAEAVAADRFGDARAALARTDGWPEDLRAKAGSILAAAKEREEEAERIARGAERWKGFVEEFVEAGTTGVGAAEEVLRRRAAGLSGFGLAERTARYGEWVREAKLVESLALDAFGASTRRVRLHVGGRPVSGSVTDVDGARLTIKPVVGDALTVNVSEIAAADIAAQAGVTSGETADPVRAGAYLLVRGEYELAAKHVEFVVDDRGEGLAADVAEVAKFLAPPPPKPVPARPEEIAAQQAAREAGPDLTEGLVAYWKFDEREGETAADASGNGHHATLCEGARFVPGGGKVGGAVAFKGSNQFVEAPKPGALERSLESSCTLTAWIRPRSKPVRKKPDENYGVLIKPGYHSGLIYEHSGYMRFCVWQGGRRQFHAQSRGPYEPGSYHHLAGVLDYDANEVRLYVDGELHGTASLPADFRIRDYGTNPWRVGIGQPWHESYRYSYDGTIDEVRIYDRALDAVAVEAIYKAADAANVSRGLVLHWPLEETRGTIVKDATGNGFDAEVHGAGDKPAWCKGRVGRHCLAFDGKDDYVMLDKEKSRALTFQKSTVAFWVRSERLKSTGTLVAKRWNGNYASFVFHTNRENGISHYWSYETDNWTENDLDSEPGVLKHAAWMHVAVTRDPVKGDFRMYLDGVEHKTRLGSRPGDRIFDKNPDQPVTIGGRFLQKTRDWGNFFDGRIDDVRIYDRVLPSDEVKALAGM